MKYIGSIFILAILCLEPVSGESRQRRNPVCRPLSGGTGTSATTTTEAPIVTTTTKTCLDTYNISANTGLAYRYYDQEVNYQQATDMCTADAAHLMMVKTRQDESDIAYIRYEIGSEVRKDTDIWLGMEQTSLYTYTYADGDTMTLHFWTGYPTDHSLWQRFGHTVYADMDTSNKDDLDCVIQDGQEFMFQWQEINCDQTAFVLCICSG